MDNMIHVGTKIDKSASKSIALLIDEVLVSCDNVRASDDVTKHALTLISGYIETKNVALSNMTLTTGDKS